MTSFMTGSFEATNLCCRSGATVDMGGNVVTNVGLPTSGLHAASRDYVSSELPLEVKVQRTTGVVTGGDLTLSGDTTQFDVSPGSGIIIDPITGVKMDVTWGAFTDQGSPPYSGTASSVFIVAGGAVSIVAGEPANSAFRDSIFLGVLHHRDGVGILDALSRTPMPALSVGNQLHDCMRAVGPLNISGNVIRPSSGLTFNKSVGTILEFGANFRVDAKAPHISTQAFVDTNAGGTFTYRYQDGSSILAQTDIDPFAYDNGNGAGSPGVVADSKWTTQRICLTSSGAIFVQPDQATYGNKSASIAAALTAPFVSDPFLATYAVVVGYITIHGNDTTIDATGATAATKFGTLALPGLAARTLQGAYDAADEAPTVTTDANGGAVVVKRGSAADADLVFEVTDAADAAQFEVYGDRVAFPVAQTPASDSAAGSVGQFAWDASYFYICVAANTWRRVAHASGW